MSVIIVLTASSLVVDDAIVERVDSEPPLAWQASPVVHSLDRSTRGMSLDKKAMVLPLGSNLVRGNWRKRKNQFQVGRMYLKRDWKTGGGMGGMERYKYASGMGAQPHNCPFLPGPDEGSRGRNVVNLLGGTQWVRPIWG